MRVRPCGREDALCCLGRRALDAVGQGEFQTVLVELSGRDALALLGRDCRGANDLDRLVAGTVPASHVIVHSINSPRELRGSVLAVHVVCAAARVILDPDAKVLDVAVVLLCDLVHVENLASRLLHLAHLVHEIPKPRLGHHLIGGKQLHAVSRGVLLLLRAVRLGRLAAHDLV